MNGRALRDGLQLADLSLSDLLDVVVSYAVDDEVARATVRVAEDRLEPLTRRRARDTLFGGPQAGAAAGRRPESVADADPETWGKLPEHQAAMRAAMAMAGGPAAPLAGPR